VRSSTGLCRFSHAPIPGTLHEEALRFCCDRSLLTCHVVSGRVMAADVSADNGVIHAIDTVVMPK
jgi:uncharacterized surface protein with fasciclin (FAS1) repeats